MNRELDIQIAKAKGFDVVGETWCRMFMEGCNDWYVIGKETEQSVIQPIYLDRCICDLYDDETFKRDIENGLTVPLFGHYDNCFSVVPFWVSDFDAAFKLIDEMKVENYSVDIKIREELCKCIVVRKLGVYNIEQLADTPQEAICKAYLEWCDLTKNQI